MRDGIGVCYSPGEDGDCLPVCCECSPVGGDVDAECSAGEDGIASVGKVRCDVESVPYSEVCCRSRSDDGD